MREVDSLFYDNVVYVPLIEEDIHHIKCAIDRLIYTMKFDEYEPLEVFTLQNIIKEYQKHYEDDNSRK